MPDYITFGQMKAAMPADILAQLLDDSGSGAPDMAKWTELLVAVTREIDGKLEQKYPLPLATVPNSIGDAAFVLAAELLYQGRGYYEEANPWTKRAKGVRSFLDALANGEKQLLPTAAKVGTPAAAITETAKTFPSDGSLMM